MTADQDEQIAAVGRALWGIVLPVGFVLAVVVCVAALAAPWVIVGWYVWHLWLS